MRSRLELRPFNPGAPLQLFPFDYGCNVEIRVAFLDISNIEYRSNCPSDIFFTMLLQARQQLRPPRKSRVWDNGAGRTEEEAWQLLLSKVRTKSFAYNAQHFGPMNGFSLKVFCVNSGLRARKCQRMQQRIICRDGCHRSPFGSFKPFSVDFITFN